MFNKLLALTRNTFLETVRQPVYNVFLWVAVGLLAVNPSLAGFSLEGNEGDIKIVKDVGLATLLLWGLLVSVFSASSVITREIESYTVLTVIAKPVNRGLFLCGKYLGVCGAVLPGYALLSLAFMLSVRHGTMAMAVDPFDQPVLVLSAAALGISLAAATMGNFMYGWHFPSTLLAWVLPLATIATGIVLFFDKKWNLQSPFKDFGDLQIVYALLMSFCGIVILAAFAVTLATRCNQVLTLTLCAAIYVLGLMSDYYLGQPAEEGRAQIYHLLYAVVPNFQFFWCGDALTQGQIIPAVQVGKVAAYACLYSLAVLGLGIALFETREVG